MTEIDVHALLRNAEEQKAARAAQMPTDADCFRVMVQAVQRLKELGWAEAIYCPKDGSAFEAIEAGCSLPGTCIYMGDWPDGGWWMQDAGDLWPSRPILWRPLPVTPNAEPSGPARSAAK